MQCILVQGFCPLIIKITQFINGFRLKSFSHFHQKKPKASERDHCQMFDTCWNFSFSQFWLANKLQKFLNYVYVHCIPKSHQLRKSIRFAGTFKSDWENGNNQKTKTTLCSTMFNGTIVTRGTGYETLQVSKAITKVLQIMFSNSLIIHKEKTKEITTVTVVWIPDLN